MLMAPQFLYRGVPISSPAIDQEVEPLDDHALATRLSYFLWGSTPDDALLARADEGVLSDGSGLRAEFDRMLADPKASAREFSRCNSSMASNADAYAPSFRHH